MGLCSQYASARLGKCAPLFDWRFSFVHISLDSVCFFFSEGKESVVISVLPSIC
jgi:hypothetical protein